MNQYFILLFSLIGTVSFAQMSSIESLYVKDSNGNYDTMNYSIAFRSTIDGPVSMMEFIGKNTLIYFIGNSCISSGKKYPEYHAIMENYSKDGLNGFILSGRGSKLKTDSIWKSIYNFVEPISKDTTELWWVSYGDGYVPMLLLVLENGRYIRFSALDADMFGDARRALDAVYGILSSSSSDDNISSSSFVLTSSWLALSSSSSDDNISSSSFVLTSSGLVLSSSSVVLHSSSGSTKLASKTKNIKQKSVPKEGPEYLVNGSIAKAKARQNKY